MWNSVLVLSLLIQQNVISSALVSENPREVRQSNFPECCPCPVPKQDVNPNQDTANSHIIAMSADDSCPCRLASDIESASSLISPVFRNMEQHNRQLSSKKEEIKALLKPEVGLASSVLETLKEVTDQEYQEAVARDAARSVLKFIDPLENESRNSMNIILNPNSERREDINSDASYFQETSYERPFSSNSLERLGSQSPLNMLGKILSSPKLSRNTILHKKKIDMDEGASNIQKDILSPVKNSVLDQMKLKADTLKLKLFPNIENRLKNQAFKDFIQTDARTNKLLKPLKHIIKNAEYTEPSKFTEEDLLENMTCPQSVQNLTISYKNDMTNLDGQSEISDVRNIDNVMDNIDKLKQNELSDTFNKPLQNRNIDKNNIVSDTGYFNKKIIPTYNSNVEVSTARVIEEIQKHDSQNLRCLGSMNDSQFESSNIINQNVTLRDNLNAKLTSSAENMNEIRGMLSNYLDHQINNQLLPSSHEDQNPTDLEVLKLPNIKADILRTLENFKMANENIQEKLKSNVQDALRAVAEKTESTIGKRVSLVKQQKDNNKPYKKDENNIDIQDLQKLSDSLLKQSFLKENGRNLQSPESSNDTKKAFHGVSTFPLLVFSNNTNNLEKSKSSNHESNLNSINMAGKENKNQTSCDYEIMSNGSTLSNMDNENNEMTAQSSNSVQSTMDQLHLSPSVLESLSKHRIIQGDEANEEGPLDTTTDYFENYKTPNANTVKDDGISDFGYSKNADKNIDCQNFNRDGDSSVLNPASNLNSYTTKIATPQSLNFKSLHSLESDDDVMALPSQNYPANILRYPSEDNFVTKLLRNNGQNELNPHFKIPQGKFFTDKFSNLVPSISENIRSRANNALNFLQDSLDAGVNKPSNINKNNIFTKSPLNSKNLLDAVLKTRKNLNDRLEVFKPDVNKRPSSNFPKIPFRNVGVNPNKLSISENSAEFNKPLEIKPTNLRNTLHNLRRMESFKKKPILISLAPNKSTDIVPDISQPSLRSNIKKKLEGLAHELKPNSNKVSIDVNRPKQYQTKMSIANRSKLKPLKENKIIIRPDPIESNIRPSFKMNDLKSRTPNLTKFTRKPSIKSNLDFHEPKILASNDLISKVPYPDLTLKGDKIVDKPLALEASVEPQTMKNNKHILKARQKTLVLPKFKNAFTAKSLNQDENRLTKTDENVDGTLSASNNIDQSATFMEPMKENTSYKCKMVCIKDILDVK